MNNYEKIKSLSIKELAKINVKYQSYMNGYRPDAQYVTTDGNIFDFREVAEKYEEEWLNQEEDKEVFDFT